MRYTVTILVLIPLIFGTRCAVGAENGDIVNIKKGMDHDEVEQALSTRGADCTDVKHDGSLLSCKATGGNMIEIHFNKKGKVSAVKGLAAGGLGPKTASPLPKF